MEFYQRDFFVSRIQAGYLRYKINDVVLHIHEPSTGTDYEANEIYLEAYEEGQEELCTDDYIYELLIQNDMWSEEEQKELDDVAPKHIEYWQEKLFQSSFDTEQQVTFRKYLTKAKRHYNSLHEKRSVYNYMTLSGYATFAKNIYSVSHSTKHVDGTPVDWNKIDIVKVMNYIYQSSITQEQIREIARTSPWTTLWHTRKKNNTIFDRVKLTQDQQQLISWSAMYDNIRESPDCPADNIIEDDDMLDGWLSLQRKKRIQEQSKKDADQQISNSKIQGSDEIFVMANNQQDLDRINQLNDPRGSSIKAGRIKQVSQQGILKEHQLNDVKQARSMQVAQAYATKMKG